MSDDNKSHTSSSQFDQVNHTVEGIANKIVDKTPMRNIQNKAENVKETAKDIPSAIKNKIKGDSDTHKTESFADDVVSEQSPNIDKSSKHGESDKPTFKDKLGNKADQIKENIGDGADKLRKGAKDAFDNSIAGKSIKGVKTARNGIKQAKDRVSHGVKNVKKTAKDFKNAEGIKGKTKFVAGGVGRRAKKKWANSKTREKVKKFVATVKRIIAIIKAVYIPLAITMGLILLIGNFVVWAYSVYAAVGRTPHYYCDIETDDPGIKRSYLYQQYCANGSGLNLEELNGHYIIQSGSGPCTSCATLNLWMRFFAANDINFFDYLWNENGETLNKVDKNGSEESTTFSAIGRGTCKYPNFVNDSRYPKASQFMSQHGKGNYATMGYVYNEEEYTEQEDLTGSDDWTFTTLLGNVSDTHYGCHGWDDGVTITIENASLTMKVDTDPAHCKIDYIKTIMDAHPSGIIIYFKCNSDYGYHGVLLTKYEDGKLYMVDSAPRLRGGWELPVETKSEPELWSESVQAGLGNRPIVGIHYIENDVTN